MDGSQQISRGSAPSRSEALQSWIRALDAIRIMEVAPETTLPWFIDELAETHGDRPALLGEGDDLSYRQLAARANRHAAWAVGQGLGRGDVVCLLMPNCPDYVAIWLGLTRAGCVVALLNIHLVADGLRHSIAVAGAAHLIVADSLSPAVSAIADDLPPSLQVWLHGVTAPGPWRPFAMDITDAAVMSASQRPRPMPQDVALLIYTSGTTGLPKAARVTHARIVEWSFWFAGMMDAQPDDRLYDCLPLYHSVGGIVAIGAMLVRGASVLIRPRFSASHFWNDVVDGGCTIFQYIGELCRYLTSSPPHPKERAHRLRLACGNGLQGDVWTEAQQRFAIPRILEFYAATEGSVSLYNCEGRPGAIGRVPAFLAHRFPVALIRVDAQSGAPVRGADGLCVACDEAGEVGEALGQIGRGRRFDGYTDAAASARKVLSDVFTHGDTWFRTGDLMRKDAAGYYYFVDRIGDTYRWKGENVSTTEVAAVLRAFPGVTDAVVYGVAVPGHEGRAGMAAITTDARFDLEALHAHLSSRLPAYAQPLFVRLCAALDVTGTFKLTKGKLAQEGFADVDDPVWFHKRSEARFINYEATTLATQKSL